MHDVLGQVVMRKDLEDICELVAKSSMVRMGAMKRGCHGKNVHLNE